MIFPGNPACLILSTEHHNVTRETSLPKLESPPPQKCRLKPMPWRSVALTKMGLLRESVKTQWVDFSWENRITGNQPDFPMKIMKIMRFSCIFSTKP